MDIRNILNIISENSETVKGGSPFSDKLNVLTLGQFLNLSGIETPDEEDAEIDEAKLDAPARKMAGDELEQYLDRIKGLSTGKKTPRGLDKYVSGKTKQDKYKKPYIHRSTIIPIVDEEGKKYNLDALRSIVTKRPSKILKQNEKMQHSDGTASVFYNVGIPALKGLAVDEDTGDFVIIDTCPGAGACQTYCYAMKGGYVQWKNVAQGQTQMLNFLYNDPAGFMKMMGDEIQAADKKFNKKDKKTKLVIRWHDAGDFFSPQYLAMAYALAKQYPNVDFYAYTKLASVAKSNKPDNFKINYSMGAKPSQEKEIDFAKTKNSRVVPEVLFKDLLDRDAGKVIYKDQQSINTLKQRIAAKYSVDPNSILTYEEMMKTPPSNEKNKWNVIVKPGDGDDSANRNDVLNSFLLMH
jgi:hypothetical protein